MSGGLYVAKSTFTTGPIVISSIAPASWTRGALVVSAGGASIYGDTYIGGSLYGNGGGTLQVSAAGLNVGGDAVIQNNLNVKGEIGWKWNGALYQSKVTWNTSNAGGGSTEIINNPGSGSAGGFSFYDTSATVVNAQPLNNALLHINKTGEVHIANTTRIYSTSNIALNTTLPSPYNVRGVNPGAAAFQVYGGAAFLKDVYVGSNLSVYGNLFWGLDGQGSVATWNKLEVGRGGTEFINDSGNGAGGGFSFWDNNYNNTGLRGFLISLTKYGDLDVRNGITAGGNIFAAGNVTAFSDKRLKENIVTIDSALDKVLKMRGVYYTSKGGTKRNMGVIAQELEDILPEVVFTDEKDMKSVAYGNIVGILIEAIKEQQAIINKLIRCKL